MSARDKVIEALKTFNWGRHSLDEVALGLADHPDEQRWLSPLADHVLAALDAQPFHTTELREGGWTLKHPLDCRDDLFNCLLNRALQVSGPPPGGPGIYRVDLDGGVLVVGERMDPVAEKRAREVGVCSNGCGIAPDEDGRCACPMPEAAQVAGGGEILAPGLAGRAGEAVPVEVEEEDGADDVPHDSPEAGTSSGRWQPLGEPGGMAHLDFAEDAARRAREAGDG